jgi:outer membrane lipoprotein SlyB
MSMNPKLALTRLALLALVGSTLSGCIVYPRPYHERPYGPPPGPPPNAVVVVPQAPPAPRYSYNDNGRGQVTNIEVLRQYERPTGGGAVLGGIVGAAVIGAVMGGRGAGVVAGAIGGAVVGNEIERNQTPAYDTFRITVRLDNGVWRQFVVTQPNGLRVGDAVRVEGPRIFPG